MRIAIELAYDGSAYSGWQMQTGQLSIQEKIQESLGRLLGRETKVTGCGRTDTGVHALHYIAHIDIEQSELHKINVYQLNATLPYDIAVQHLYKVQDDFHARYNACYRKYIYYIHTRKNPFLRERSFLYHQLNATLLTKLQEVADLIAAEENFESLTKSNSGLSHFRCIITESRWIHPTSDIFEYHIAANRFLRGMVRLCVGACLNYASGRIALDQIKSALNSRQQLPKSWSVPAHALFLTEVRYPENSLILIA
ncbi:MAG: tRNA pseudouridine(38-40) synthase TruA [Saprospiraceae bacterium]